MKIRFLKIFYFVLMLGFLLPLVPCCLPLVCADNISIAASVNKSAISLDDQIVLQLNVSGNVSNLPNPNIPDMPNFTVYSSGRSQSLSIVNGQMSSSVIYHYTLAPKNVGKYTLSPITLQYDNKTYSTDPIQVEVLPAGKAPASGQGGQVKENAVASIAQKNLYITATVDRPTAYVNEQIVYDFKFYRKIKLLANPGYTPANFTGFWTEDTAPKNYYAAINGSQYVVTEVKTLLFPTKPGKFNLGAASLQCSVQDFNQNDPSADEFFSSFFSGGKTQVLHTDPVAITVLPLPEQGKPSNFTGAVGQFKITASLDKKSILANQAVTLTVLISGAGNIKTLPEPTLPPWPDFKMYETVSSLNINKDEDVVKGSKEFKTVMVPLTAGQRTIKPISFSYFDPHAKAYRTVSTEPLVLDVKPAAPGSAQNSGIAGIKNEVNVFTSDIRYIKSLNRWETSDGYLLFKPWFQAINAFPLVVLGILFGFVKWQEKLSGDVAFARRLRASSTAKKYLKKARAMLNSHADAVEYYNAVSRALLEFIANKTNVSADGLISSSIGEILSARKVKSETIANVNRIIDECNLVRFAPTSVTSEMMRSVFDETSDVISRLEKEMR